MGILGSKLGNGLIAVIATAAGFFISLLVLVYACAEPIKDKHGDGVESFFIYFGIAMLINTFCFYSLFFLLRWLFGKK